MAKIKRVYHHCDLLEEAPMWGNAPPSESDRLISEAKTLLSDCDMFLIACRKVFIAWPYSSEHNLSAVRTNRKAWLGWAACYVAIGSTEYTTRNGWRLLSKQQQDEANNTAQKAIEEWEIEYAKDRARDKRT